MDPYTPNPDGTLIEALQTTPYRNPLTLNSRFSLKRNPENPLNPKLLKEPLKPEALYP